MRWTISDGAATPTIISFPINPNSGGSFTRSRNLSKDRTLTGKPYVAIGSALPRTAEITGVILDEDSYNFLVTIFENMVQVLLTDDLERETWVFITDLELTSEPRRHSQWRHKYKMKLTEVNVP